MRDDFTEDTKRKLRERVGARCSRPDCRRSTLGPLMNSDDALRLGRAAHITAAARGGPRYDGSLTRNERKHINNGIWLCCDHADEVDRDHHRYPTELLRSWKVAAELAAHREIGRPLPAVDDAINQTLAVIGTSPTKFLPSAMANTSAAVSRYLFEKDPTVRIIPEFYNGRTNYRLESASPVEIELSAEGRAQDELLQALAIVQTDGADVTLSLDDIAVTASPAIEFLLQDARSMTIGGVRREGVIRIGVRPLGGGETLTVEFKGDARHGSQRLSIEASAFNGVLSVKLVMPLVESGGAAKWTLATSFSPWLGINLVALPHIDRAVGFVRLLSDGQPASLEIEVDGLQVTKGSTKGPTDVEEFKKLIGAFEYVADARDIAAALRLDVPFAQFSITSRHAGEVRHLADLFRTSKEPRPMREDEEFDLRILPPADLFLHDDPAEDRILKVVTPKISVPLFGTQVEAPSFTSVITGMRLALSEIESRTTTGVGSALLKCVPSERSTIQSWRNP
jgi:hypothetical protein